jgi:hypothetical protein
LLGGAREFGQALSILGLYGSSLLVELCERVDVDSRGLEPFLKGDLQRLRRGG